MFNIKQEIKTQKPKSRHPDCFTLRFDFSDILLGLPDVHLAPLLERAAQVLDSWFWVLVLGHLQRVLDVTTSERSRG